jgi:hypothetical protein
MVVASSCLVARRVVAGLVVVMAVRLGGMVVVLWATQTGSEENRSISEGE